MIVYTKLGLLLQKRKMYLKSTLKLRVLFKYSATNTLFRLLLRMEKGIIK